MPAFSVSEAHLRRATSASLFRKSGNYPFSAREAHHTSFSSASLFGISRNFPCSAREAHHASLSSASLLRTPGMPASCLPFPSAKRISAAPHPLRCQEGHVTGPFASAKRTTCTSRPLRCSESPETSFVLLAKPTRQPPRPLRYFREVCQLASDRKMADFMMDGTEISSYCSALPTVHHQNCQKHVGRYPVCSPVAYIRFYVSRLIYIWLSYKQRWQAVPAALAPVS